MPSPESPEPSSDLDPPLQELEARLARLHPAELPAGSGKRIGLRLDALATEREESRRLRRRFATLAIAAGVVIGTLSWFQAQLATSDSIERSGEPALASESEAAAAPSETPRFVSPPPIETGIPSDHFVPVSSQQHLRQASSDGVMMITDEIPARRVTIEYDRAWHWHDPGTRTNIRIFQPRAETVLVPLKVD